MGVDTRLSGWNGDCDFTPKSCEMLGETFLLGKADVYLNAPCLESHLLVPGARRCGGLCLALDFSHLCPCLFG